MDQLRAMRVFTRVIDEGSFAKAARALDLAPAVVTRVIAELEDSLGARLINRTTRSLALTEVGDTYLKRVRQILVDIDEANALAADAVSEPAGHLRVLVPPAFAVHQLAKRLPRFRRDYPKVTLEFTVPGPVETVDDAHDISIIMVNRNRVLQGDFIARQLALSEVITCASPEYLDQRGRPQHPRDLVHHDPVVPTLAALPRNLTFHRGVASDDEPAPDSVTVQMPTSALDSNHVDTNYAAALAGLGVAGLPSFVAEDALMEHALERVLPEWHLLTLTIYAGMPSRKYVPARTRAFMDFLLAEFGGQDIDPWLSAAGCATPWLGPQGVAARGVA